jgi:transcription antitermination factor NusG
MNAWYTVFCKPCGEKTAETDLENQGYAVYLPRLLAQRRRAGKWVKRIEPLFARYLFLKPGAAVKFSDGPLQGLEGIFSKETGEKRVIVLLNLLGKINTLRVNRDWLVPVT